MTRLHTAVLGYFPSPKVQGQKTITSSRTSASLLRISSGRLWNVGTLKNKRDDAEATFFHKQGTNVQMHFRTKNLQIKIKQELKHGLMTNKENECCTRKNLESEQNWAQIPLIITCGTTDASVIMGRKPLFSLSVCVTRSTTVPSASLGPSRHSCTSTFTQAHRQKVLLQTNSCSCFRTQLHLRPSSIHPTTLEASSLPNSLQLGQVLPPWAPVSLANTVIRYLIGYLFLGVLPVRI